MKLILSQKSKINKTASELASRYFNKVQSLGGVVQNMEFVHRAYWTYLSNVGEIPRHLYSSLGGMLFDSETALNKQVYSEDLTQVSGWSSEQLVAISRVPNLDYRLPFAYWNEIKENTTNNRHTLYSSFSLGSNTWIVSFYTKQGVGTRYIQLAGAGLAANDEAVVFNLQNGTFKKGITSTILKSVYMIPQAEGYRCVVVLQTSTGSGFQLNLSNVDDSVTDVPSYLGNGSNSIFVSGFQVQALNSHNRATKYIKTLETEASGNANYVKRLFNLNLETGFDFYQDTLSSMPLLDDYDKSLHKTINFNGSTSFMANDDLGIFRNQPYGTILALMEDYDISNAEAYHYAVSVAGEELPEDGSQNYSRASLVPRMNTNKLTIISRRASGLTTQNAQAPTTYGGALYAIEGNYRWADNSMRIFKDGVQLASSDTDGAGNLEDRDAYDFRLGSYLDTRFTPMMLAGLNILYRKITAEERTAIRDLNRLYYPTLP